MAVRPAAGPDAAARWWRRLWLAGRAGGGSARGGFFSGLEVYSIVRGPGSAPTHPDRTELLERPGRRCDVKRAAEFVPAAAGRRDGIRIPRAITIELGRCGGDPVGRGS